MCNLYLDHQESRGAIGEVKPRHVSDQVSLLKAFVRAVGPQQLVSAVSTLDLQNYRTRLIGAKNSPNTISNRIAAVKAMYNWALGNEIIDCSPRLKALKKVTPQKAGMEAPKGVGFYTLRRTAATVAANAGDPFAVQKLLSHADVKMASTYVQNISEQTDRVINRSRKVMVEGNS
jgi:integrase